MQSRITRIFACPLNARLRDPFTIATGELTQVTNVAVGVEVDGDIIGWGECPVLPPVTNVSQGDALTLVSVRSRSIIGRSVTPWQRVCRHIRTVFDGYPSVSCAVEMAAVDACARVRNQPLHALLGGRGGCVQTDITIPICPADQAFQLAMRYKQQGFQQIKTKVGRDMASDIERLKAICDAFPTVELLLDANEGFSASDSLNLLGELDSAGIYPRLLEQPVERTDWDGLRAVSDASKALVAADESCRSVADAERICEDRLASVINIKLAKVGVLGALEIIHLAEYSDIKLMIGAMVETRLGCGFAAHLVSGRPIFHFVDLDTAHLLCDDPIIGGPVFEGPRIDLSSCTAGHGMSVTM